MTIQEWDEARNGKPINEWPPIPDDITHIAYPQGIIIINKKPFMSNLCNNIEYYAMTRAECFVNMQKGICPALNLLKEEN